MGYEHFVALKIHSNFNLGIKLQKLCNPHISYLSTWEKFTSLHIAHDLLQNPFSDRVWVHTYLNHLLELPDTLAHNVSKN